MKLFNIYWNIIAFSSNKTSLKPLTWCTWLDSILFPIIHWQKSTDKRVNMNFILLLDQNFNVQMWSYKNSFLHYREAVEDIVSRDYYFLLNDDKLSCDGQWISNLTRKKLSRVEWKQWVNKLSTLAIFLHYGNFSFDLKKNTISRLKFKYLHENACNLALSLTQWEITFEYIEEMSGSPVHISIAFRDSGIHWISTLLRKSLVELGKICWKFHWKSKFPVKKWRFLLNVPKLSIFFWIFQLGK